MAKEKPNQSHVVLYQTADGQVTVDVRFERENFWLTQKALAELFGVQRPAITKHLGNVFSYGELAENSVCSTLEHTAGDGKTYSAQYYNLDAAIAVGYRVNSVTHSGKISHEMAVARAHEEFEKFRVKQDQQYVSNFDEAFARYLKGGGGQ